MSQACCSACGNTAYWRRRMPVTYPRESIDLDEQSPRWTPEDEFPTLPSYEYECGECGEAADEDTEEALNDV